MFIILRPQSVAAWEECIRICCIKPLQISQTHTQTNLKKTGNEYILIYCRGISASMALFVEISDEPWW